MSHKEDHNSFVFIPYVHSFSHRLKIVASKFRINVGFSSKTKLKGTFQALNRRIDRKGSRTDQQCSMKYALKFVPCIRNVVYTIPFSCGRQYIGHTGQFLNIRLREHHSSLKVFAHSHLSMHYRDCERHPLSDKTNVLFMHPDKLSREIAEAFL